MTFWDIGEEMVRNRIILSSRLRVANKVQQQTCLILPQGPRRPTLRHKALYSSRGHILEPTEEVCPDQRGWESCCA